MRWANATLRLLPAFPGATVVLESNYFTATAQTTRQGMPTQYGYDQLRRRLVFDPLG